MKRIALRATIVLVTMLGVVYAGDYCVVRYRVPNDRYPFAQVVVQPFYVIHQKNGKIDYERGEPENDQCIRSLFPHMGYAPCWYLSRHTEKHIDI
jgi:hypothetical protein